MGSEGLEYEKIGSVSAMHIGVCNRGDFELDGWFGFLSDSDSD